jgi:protease-4
MDKRAVTVLVVIFGGLFIAVFGFLALAFSASKDEGSTSSFGGKDGIGVIEVKGQIANLDKQVKAFRKFEKDDHVKIIIMRVDSPGGAVAPSQELHDEVQRTIKKGKPVLVSMGNLAASGGYYISCGATKIFADPGTLTASIGVIFEMPNMTGVADWAKFKMITYKSGKLKDSGNPFREPNEDDAKYFNDVIADVYDQFLTAVAEGRKLTKDEVRPYADGRVLTGIQAKQAKLIDELGGFSATIDEAMTMAKLEGEPHLIYPPEEKEGLFKELMKDSSETATRGVISALRSELGNVLPQGTSGPAFLLPIPVSTPAEP